MDLQCSINSSVGCPATHLRRRGDCLTVGAARGALCGAQCEACVQPLPGPAAQCTRCCATQRCIAPLQLWLAALRWPLLLSALRVPAGCGNWGFELHNSSSLQFARWDLRRGALEEAGRAKRSQCAGKKTVRPWGRSQLRRACPILPRRPYVCHKRTAADLLRCAQETLSRTSAAARRTRPVLSLRRAGARAHRRHALQQPPVVRQVGARLGRKRVHARVLLPARIRRGLAPGGTSKSARPRRAAALQT